jgi:hypothetical protein
VQVSESITGKKGSCLFRTVRAARLSETKRRTLHYVNGLTQSSAGKRNMKFCQPIELSRSKWLMCARM